MITLAKPSALSLFIELRFSGTILATGTAFIVMGRLGPLLITNRHNFTGRNQDTGALLSANGGVPNEVVIYHHLMNALGQAIPKVEELYAADCPLWHEHPRLRQAADFVALPLTELTDVAVYEYEIHKQDVDLVIGPTDTVSVIGFPFGLSAGGNYAIWCTGFIASEPQLDYNDLPMLLIDCRARKGQSGSPVIAYRKDCWVGLSNGTKALLERDAWKFVGIYSGRINEESDIGRVWKANAIHELALSL